METRPCIRRHLALLLEYLDREDGAGKAQRKGDQRGLGLHPGRRINPTSWGGREPNTTIPKTATVMAMCHASGLVAS